ncbi:MAG: hypothetical protein PHH77_05405 [Victivallaceae bacterium]|nr:hypothetical protein [Victivallaceae bacterium]
MLPFSRTDLEKLTEDKLPELADLDSSGFLVGGREDFEKFRRRLLNLNDALAALEEKLAQGEDEVELFEGVMVRCDQRIPVGIIAEAGDVTEKCYRFSISWVPGFFLSRDLGWFWGGCAISDSQRTVTVFLIRSSFRNRRKWFIYDRRELLAHELCHAARNVINDNTFEEFFAYQTAPSRLRRYMGNCFIHKYDAVLFLSPALILLAAQMVKTCGDFAYPIWPFWLFALAYPAYLLLRNNIARVTFFRACSKLLAFGFPDAPAILFRCSQEEIKELALLASPETFRRFVQNRASINLRWRIIQHRFVINQGEQNHGKTEEANGAA